MFTVTKTIEVSIGHCLTLPYKSPCQNPHGHNLKIFVSVSGEVLTEYGMIVDFSEIKKIVMQMDHKNLNDLFNFNPTAEKIAQWIRTSLNDMLHQKGYDNKTE